MSDARVKAGVPEPAGDEWEPPTWLGWGFVALMCAAGILAAVVEVFLIPVYAGSIPVPVAVVLAIGLNVVIPWLAHDAVRRPSAAVLPVAAWLVAAFTLVSAPGSAGDVLGPGGDLTWVTYGVLFGGALAGAVSVVKVSTPGPGGRP